MYISLLLPEGVLEDELELLEELCEEELSALEEELAVLEELAEEELSVLDEELCDKVLLEEFCETELETGEELCIDELVPLVELCEELFCEEEEFSSLLLLVSLSCEAEELPIAEEPLSTPDSCEEILSFLLSVPLASLCTSE